MEGSNNYKSSRDVTITTPEVHSKTNDLIMFGQIGIGLTLIVSVLLTNPKSLAILFKAS